jgi:hypothetical protein
MKTSRPCCLVLRLAVSKLDQPNRVYSDKCPNAGFPPMDTCIRQLHNVFFVSSVQIGFTDPPPCKKQIIFRRQLSPAILASSFYSIWCSQSAFLLTWLPRPSLWSDVCKVRQGCNVTLFCSSQPKCFNRILTPTSPIGMKRIK